MLRPPPTSTLFPYTTLFRSSPESAPSRVRPAVFSYRSSPVCLHLWDRSEEHTSELQSRGHLVCRLLLEKKKKQHRKTRNMTPDAMLSTTTFMYNMTPPLIHT